MKKTKVITISLLAGLSTVGCGVITTALSSCGSSNQVQAIPKPENPSMPNFGNHVKLIHSIPDNNKVFVLDGKRMNLLDTNKFNVIENNKQSRRLKYTLLSQTDDSITLKILSNVKTNQTLLVKYGSEIVAKLVYVADKAQFDASLLSLPVQAINDDNEYALTGTNLHVVTPNSIKIKANNKNIDWELGYTVKTQISIKVNSLLTKDTTLQCFYNNKLVANLAYKAKPIIDPNIELNKLFEFADDKKTVINNLVADAKNLTEIIIPSQVTTISEGVFENLEQSNIKTLDFSNCTKLLTLPANAFKNSSNINTLLLPPNLTTINSEQLNSLVNIERINWPANISSEEMIAATWNIPVYIPVVEDWNIEGDQVSLPVSRCGTFFDGKWYKTHTKPSGTRIYLVPKVVTRMYLKPNEVDHAHRFSPAKNVYFQNESSLTTIENDVFANELIEKVIFPSSLKIIKDHNLFNLENLTTLESENNFKNLEVATIGNFETLPKVQKIDLSEANKITQFYSAAFRKLYNIQTLILPKTLESMRPIDEYSMWPMWTDDVNNLKEMPIPPRLDFLDSDLDDWFECFNWSIRFKTPNDNNIVDYSDLYADNSQIVGIWVDGLSTQVNKPDKSKLPKLSFVSYRDKVEHYN